MQKVNLFGEEKRELNSITSMKFDDFKEGKNLYQSNFSEFKTYYSEYDKLNPMYYHCNPVYNDVLGESQYRYLIFTDNDDDIFVAYKIIQIVKTKRIKIIDKPISKLGNKLLEIKCIKLLNTLDFTMFSFKDKYNSWYDDFNYENNMWDSDYYLSRSSLETKFTNKYKNKKLINRYERDDRFKVVLTSNPNIDELKELRSVWEHEKEKVADLTNRKNFYKFTNSGYNNIKFVNIYYLDKCICSYVFIVENGFALNIFRSSISRTKFGIDDTFLRSSIQHLDSVATYFSLKLLNVDYIYYSGVAEGNYGVIDYKEKHSDGKILYNVVKGENKKIKDDELTPIEKVGNIYLKRDDKYNILGSTGGKARVIYKLLNDGINSGFNEFVTAGSRMSSQCEIISCLCEKLGVKCHIFMPKGENTSIIDTINKNGNTELHRTNVGYNNVICKYAKDFAEENNFRYIPFSLECSDACDITCNQVLNIPDYIKRIVMPIGGGMSFIGVLNGLQMYGRKDIEVIGVSVGKSPEANINKFLNAKDIKYSIIKSDLPYEKSPDVCIIGDVELDKIYEAKCLPFVNDGDLLWLVGKRI